jgi:hypothetical protein
VGVAVAGGLLGFGGKVMWLVSKITFAFDWGGLTLVFYLKYNSYILLA